MALILEGCDAVGKDTFAELLSEKTKYEIVRGSSFEIAELGADKMFEHMMNLLDRDDIIINRFFYSNLVYGKLFNYPMMKPHQYDQLVEKLDETSLLVYLHTSNGKIKYRMEKRGDDMIKVEDVSNILEVYKEELYGDFRPKLIMSFDTTHTNFEKETDLIAGIMN